LTISSGIIYIELGKMMKTVVQCDFDGTITEEDVSFLLLDAFADGSWRQLLEEYREGRISVGAFNARAFAMVKADRQTLLEFMFMSGKVEVRPGFRELLSYCFQRDIRFVIVSNGLNFYIEAILGDMGIDNIEVFAAQSRFNPAGMEVKYIGPDGPARRAHHVFATADLLDCCQETNLDCVPFDDLNDVVRGLGLLPRG